MKVKFIFVLVLFACTAISFFSVAQDANKHFLLRGQVLNQENDEPVPFITIFNQNTKAGVASDSLGRFSIKMYASDTLIFNSLGFERYIYTYTEAAFANEVFVQVKINPKSYELKGVDVHAFKTEEAFKKHILEMELPEEKKVEISGLDMVRIDPQIRNGGDMTLVMPGPISALSNAFSRRAKEHRKYLVDKENYESSKKVALRYNAEFVKDIVGIEDEKELEDFMAFCNLGEKFIESSNDYDLIVAVHNCYDEFKEMRRK